MIFVGANLFFRLPKKYFPGKIVASVDNAVLASALEKAGKEFGLKRVEGCHDLLFNISFNAFGDANYGNQYHQAHCRRWQLTAERSGRGGPQIR